MQTKFIHEVLLTEQHLANEGLAAWNVTILRRSTDIITYSINNVKTHRIKITITLIVIIIKIP